MCWVCVPVNVLASLCAPVAEEHDGSVPNQRQQPLHWQWKLLALSMREIESQLEAGYVQEASVSLKAGKLFEALPRSRGKVPEPKS